MAETCCEFKVISVSSEDAEQKASNIAVQDLYATWQTEPGEEKASILLELPAETTLHTIEIVNAGSTNVEIYVTNSENQQDEEILLPTAIMMTLGEVNSNTNTNRLRFFGPDKLTKGISDKAWKYIKIVCISFDTSRKPFGLARIRLFSSAPSDEYIASSIADNRSSMVSVPSSQPTTSTYVPQKYASRSKSFAGPPPDTTIAHDTNNKKTPNHTNTANKSNNNNRTNDTNNSPAKSAAKRKRVIMNDDYDDTEGDSAKDQNPRSLTSLHISPHVKKSVPVANRSKSLVFTSFNKILSGVSFVVSGIANPERQELRDKAIEMGAQYYADWIESATHLICPFTNTPKFILAQKAGGTIVTPAWILDCYKNKVRLPETEYLLAEVKKIDDAGMKSTMGNMRDWLATFRPKFDKPANNSTNTTQSQPQPKLTKSLTFVNNARITKDSQPEADVDDTSSVSTEPMSDDEKTNNDKEPPTKMYKKDSVVSSALTDTTEDMGPTQDNVYFSTSEDDTHIDKQGTIRKDFQLNKPKKSGVFDISAPLPNYFKNIRVVLYGNFDPALKTLLYRYVTAYSGEIEDKPTSKTTHIITNQLWDKELQQLRDEYPSACIVRPSWVFDSHNEQRKVETNLHSTQTV
eukprot:Phypoly_transcript_05212.p1 GENE.Phypoly_transcript_05212~~Phypoly_transcript_05212.p1  ORF type:complete len:633 (+),score=107.00 Phypoly_transcript_05212:71-1969(+)